MGAILAVFGVNPIRTNEEAMLACSPYRGAARVMRCEGATIAIQETGGDASLARLGAWIIAFHGFIGNWADLDRQHRFNFGESDTDAHRMGMAYRHLGDKLFEKLRGEYACLIYQQNKEEIQAVRDLIGCRPLFHAVDDRRLFLASEIRQIRAGSGKPKVLNEPMVASYLMSWPIRLDMTLDQQVYRVVPGQVLTLNTAKPGVTLSNTPYWTPPPQRSETRPDRVALAEEFRHLLEQAVSRSLPDTPFGVCLSGGLDSSAVWALTAHLAKQGNCRAAQGLPISRTYPGMPCDESYLIGTMRSATGAGEFIEIPVTEVNSIQWFDYNLGRVEGYYGVIGDTIPILSQSLARNGRRVLLTGFGEEWISGSFPYLADDLLSLLRRWTQDGQPMLGNKRRLGELLIANDFIGMQSLFAAFFASIPHDWYRNNPIARYEGYYASVFYSHFAALGLDITLEDASNQGRLDMAVRFNGQIYLFEFKVVELTPEGRALQQIKDKGYADKYQAEGLPIHLIGVEFSREQRSVVGFEVESLSNTRRGE